MPQYNLSGTQLSNMSDNVTDIVVLPKVTDGVMNTGESTWCFNNATTYWGYFNTIPELKSALLMKATWDVGKGYTADTSTMVTLDHVSGWGKDTFLDILFNMDLISRLQGDAFAEIITGDKGVLLNLKVLDTASMKIVTDSKGIIKRYEQMSKTPDGSITKFKPNEIFHLSHNRLADNIHGISDIVAMENTILAELENFTDLKKIMHRQARPLIVFKLGTDDPNKIAAFATKMDAAVNKGENIYVPNDADTFSYEVVKIDLSSMIMNWREDIRNKFYRTLGLPLIVFGNGGSTESGGKIEYLAHEQVFSHDQKFIEDQVWNQLFLKIKLQSPVTLLQNLQQDNSKDGSQQQMNIQPSDVTAGSGP